MNEVYFTRPVRKCLDIVRARHAGKGPPLSAVIDYRWYDNT